MKIIVTKILSLNTDGACSYLLNIGNEVKILLDCGIAGDFNFQPYIKFKQQIQAVNLILISHSSIEYSGALPFLIEEFGIEPLKIFTSQPVMRYAPLNLHQEILNLRSPNYDKKVFNTIYSHFESIQVIKPYQKKAISIQLKNIGDSLLKSTKKSVYFSCYQAGGTLSGLTWKIRTGLINILYLVDYNNFSLNHINGLDFQAIKNQPINLLLTDMYPILPDEKIKKDRLYIDIKNVLMEFYAKQGIDPFRPKTFFGQNEKRILFTCYPNEMLMQVMIALRKVITDMQEAVVREKVVVVHLSSRYLQLIKSQVENFTEDTKVFVDKIDEFFIHSKSLTSRINVSSVNHVNGILNPVLANNPSIEIFHFGQNYSFQKMNHNFESGKQNIANFKMFKGQSNSEPRIELAEMKEEMKNEKLQEEIEIKEEEMQKDEPDNINLKIQRSLSSILKQEKQNIQPSFNDSTLLIQQKPKSLIGKYLSQISFPHFIKSHKEEDFDFNDYGLKHHLEASARPQKRTILDMQFDQQNGEQLPDLSLVAKKSTVEVMNIEFGVQETFIPIDITHVGKILQGQFMRTNFASSLKIIQILNPKHVFILNSAPDIQSQKIFKQYRSNFKNQLYNLATSPKNQCIVEIQNQIVEYKVNYLPLNQNALQKVKGRVQSINGVIHLHIQILQEKQVLEFRLEKFYKQCKQHFGRELCKFTGNGILIAGVKIYRAEHEIIVEGEYSESYFKVRKALYDFLQIR